jgi:sigma-B regulation protein RsbQ
LNPLLKNNVLVTGDGGGRTIVFSHGFGCDLTTWAAVAPAFQADARVILFDHVGSGRSDLSAYDFDRYSSLQGYADDLVELGAALELKDAIFVGHSVAAMIGMLAALKTPGQFRAMVMVCASPRYIDDGEYVGGFSRSDIDDLLEVLDSNFLAWSRSTAPAVMGNADRPELGRALSDSFCRTAPDIAKAFARATFLCDLRGEVARLDLPTLILQTQADMIAPVQVGEYLHAVLLDSKLVLMAATGHYPHISAPDETITAIKRYLDF